MRRPLSLALRLTLLFGIAASLVFSGFGWLINRAVENHFVLEDSREVEAIARAVRSALSEMHPQENVAQIQRRFDDILVGHHDATLYIVSPGGQPIYASHGPDLSSVVAQTVPLDASEDALRAWNDGQHNYSVLVRSISGGAPLEHLAYTLAIAVPTDYHIHFMAEFRQTLWLLVTASIAIMALVGRVAVRQGHAPLRNIVSRIRRISADELNIRLPPESVPVELSDLALAFNGMLERVDAAFHRLTAFNADIAHELRTPITNLMTQTQVALSRARDLEQYREVLYSNLEEYERLAQMIDDMLFLAQAEDSAPRQSGAELDLAKEVRGLFEYYEGWAEERDVTLKLDGSASCTADRNMIQRALGNLLSNAIRHTPAGESVRVELNGAIPGEVQIAVENPGPAIPPEHLPRLFDRFYRVDPSRQYQGDGAGLGLAIVRSIVEAHGGTIGVTSSAGRTRFRITLPNGTATVRGRKSG